MGKLGSDIHNCDVNPDTNFLNRLRQFSNRMGTVAGAVENFVEQNIIEREKLDHEMKGLLLGIEKFVKENFVRGVSKGLQNFEDFTQGAKVELKVKTWPHFKGDLPSYQSALASGFDVRAQLSETIKLAPGERCLVPTGLSFSIPPAFELQMRPRSGWAIRDGITLLNSPGTIDADYRGEVKVVVVNLGQTEVIVKDQDRIAQAVLCPVFRASFTLSNELDSTSRSDGGFGSTGK